MTTSISKTTKAESAIKSEEQLQDAITLEKEKHATHASAERFRELERILHDTLGRQDSEAALTLITK